MYNTIDRESSASPMPDTLALSVAEAGPSETRIQLESIVQAVGDTLIECDTNGLVLRVYAGDKSRLPGPIDALCGASLAQIVGDSGAKLMLADIRKAVDTRRCIPFEHPLHIYGEPRWYCGRAAPVVKRNKSCRSAILHLRDITSAKNGEAALRESENRFDTIVQSLDDIIMECDSEGVYLNVWPSDPARLPFPATDFVGRRAPDIFKNKMGDAIMREIHDVLETRRPITTQHEMILAGESRWFEGRTNPVVKADGSANTVAIVVREVTSRKRIETELAISQARYSALLNQINEVVFTADLRGNLTFINQAWTRITGYDAAEFTGKSLLACAPLEDRREGKNCLDLVAIGKRRSGRFIMRCISSTGTEFWLEVNVQKTIDEESRAPVLCGTMSDITQRKKFETQLEHRAFHDPLTNLANRALFMERLRHAVDRAARKRKLIAVLFLDLDNFKIVNDSLGHKAGDELLKCVARRIETAVRPGDTVARLAGDEFTVLIEDLEEVAEIDGVAERIAQVVRLPIDVGERKVTVGASLGIAINAGQYRSPDEIVRDADTAMYEAKNNNKGHSVIFDLSMNQRAVERMETEMDLRRALEKGELAVYYQPIVSLATGRVTGMEALARWNHPSKGVLSPDKFIPVAEQTGLIVPLGRLILEQACRQVKEWHDRWPDRPRLSISVNLSPIQLKADIVYQVADALERSGLEARYLKLEITESVMMHDLASTLPKLQTLNEMGVRFAVDDFGTGYSSMGSLSNLPLHTLKIDRLFVNRMNNSSADRAIVQTIVSLAKTLDLSITCEGIETRAQMSELRSLGCDQGQGYLIARPMAVEQMESFLAAQPSAAIEMTPPAIARAA